MSGVTHAGLLWIINSSVEDYKIHLLIVNLGAFVFMGFMVAMQVDASRHDITHTT